MTALTIEPAFAANPAAVALNSLGFGKPPSETRVVVAMSGGVDSSVVAALLKREGYDVVGVTLQLYDHGAAIHRRGACCAGRDIADARRVAQRLGVPHYVLDYESRFREKVILPFAQSYAEGETPIPCVACNQHIKFADLFDTALDLGADVLATGHYVASRADGRGARALHRALDSERDQSYFLFATTRAQLDLLRFPLGDMRKAEVRELARELDLTVAEKPDSQDICFVPSGRYDELVARLRPDATESGDIVHVDGRTIGRHQGLMRYTVGQRRGLGLSQAEAGGGDPLYVVRLERASRRVVVGPRSALAIASVRLRDVNWIGAGGLADIPAAGLDLAVRLRSTGPPTPARLSMRETVAHVALTVGGSGVAPGQACVFYEHADTGARVLGGGVIASTS